MPELTASVIVVTYNRPDYVRTCLEHLALQTVAPVETVVVDASPHRLTETVVRGFPSVQYLRNDLGMGFMATSRAIGVSSTTGAVVAFVDDDAFAEPEWVEALLKPYADPAVGAVGGRTRNGIAGEEDDGLDQVGLLLPDGRLTGHFAAAPGRDLEVDHLIGANMSYRRSALEEIGGIHDHWPGTCLREDADTALRMRQAGFKVVYTPDAVVFHVGGTYAKGQRFDLRYVYYGARNHVVLLHHALGPHHPATRASGGAVRRAVRDELAYAAKAVTDPGRGMKGKLRGVARGVTRAVATLAGTASGTWVARGVSAGSVHPATPASGTMGVAP